jgi:parallel beta-helix repeat protein
VASGGTVTVDSGTYTATATVSMTSCSNVIMTFQSGAELTLANGVGTDVFDVTKCTNCVFYYLNINGNGANENPSNAENRGMEVYDCSKCEVIGATITNCNRNGFGTSDDQTGDVPSGIVDSTISYCDWNGANMGSGSTDSQGDYFIGNTVTEVGDVGVTNYGVGSIVADNYIYNIQLGTHTDAEWGIATEGNGWEYIVNNTCVNCKTGIEMAPDTSAVQDDYIAYNNVTNCLYGMSITSSGHNVITHNYISGWSAAQSYYCGLGLYSETGDIITDNTLVDTSASSGLTAPISGTESNTFIGNNTITIPTSGGVAGIVISGSNNYVEGNNVQAGIGIQISSSSSGTHVYQNTLTNCPTQISNSGTGTATSFSTPAQVFVDDPSYFGTISPSAGSYSETGSVTITLTPNTGYYAVLNVDGSNVTLSNNQYTLSMASDENAYAIFTTNSK